jgi:hypothetical protein
MTSCWSRISRAAALSLVVLGVSPFTAPFSTCSLTGLDHQPDQLPFERLIHKNPLSNLDVTSNMAVALAAGATVWPPALNTIGVATVPELEPGERRQVLRAVLRV